MSSGSDDNLDEWLRATTEAITRARTTLLIACVVGILLFIATFNLYFSWLRDVLDRDYQLADPRQREMYINAMRIRFSDTAVMNVPFLGIRVFSGDINLVGALSVNVVILWMATALKKSNQSLGRLLQRAGFRYERGKPVIPANSDTRVPSTYMFHVLSSVYLFIGMRHDVVASRMMTASCTAPAPTFRVLRLIAWIPAISLIFAFSADLISMFFDSVLVPTVKGLPVSKATNDKLWLLRIVAIPLLGLIYAILKTAEATTFEKDSQILYEHLCEAVDPHWRREVEQSLSREGPTQP